MAVDLDICNDALTHLGAEPINDFTAGKTSRLCGRQYPIARDFILRSHPWNFALKRDVITPTGDLPVFGSTNKFTMPADCIRIVKVVNGNITPVKYKTEGRFIYALADEINLLYVSNSVPEGYYDVCFKRAVAAQLAGDMCYSVTQSVSLQSGLLALSKSYIAESRSYDSMENTAEDFTFNYFDDARQAGHEIYSNADFA